MMHKNGGVVSMIKLENLLLNEYFPAELPKCFSTEQAVAKCNKIKGWVGSLNESNSYPVLYSGFKNEFARRKFAVPNFYHYFKAAQCISDNSAEILKITSNSKHSLTAPQAGDVGLNRPYNKKSYSKNQTRDYVEALYQDNMYRIKLDINNFFDSIYTHSIPWALHTKKTAKKNRGNDLLGNKLDKCIRAMNADQTNGVLIGNAISRIISEIILCTVDSDIEKKYSDLQYVRYVDDYYIFVKDATLVQEVVSFIRKKLAEYELVLNENKLQIDESPFTFGSPWIDELKLFMHNNSELLLNKAITLYNKYKDIAILKYALKVVSVENIEGIAWERMESKLYNLWVRFPILTDLIIKLLLQKKDYIHKNKLKKIIYTNLEKCMALNWQQELIWVLWSIKIFGVKIKQDYTLQILRSNNDLAIIILLDCIDLGIVDRTKSVNNEIDNLRRDLEQSDTDESGKTGQLMWTSRWLLAYECQLHEWLDLNTDSFSAVKNNSFYKNLLKENIDFYNGNYGNNMKEERQIKSDKSQKILDYVKTLNNELGQTNEMPEEMQKEINDLIVMVLEEDEEY